MSKVSISNARVGLIAALVLLLAACGVVPVSRPAGDHSVPAKPEIKSVDEQKNTSKVRMVVAAEPDLPKQKYASDGNKIPYQAMPNPYLNSAVKVPSEAVAQYNQANQYLKQGKLKEARKEFKSLTRNYKELSGPWVKIAEIALQREQFEDAFNAYEKALKVNPNNMAAYMDLAKLYRERGKFDLARNTYFRALNAWPDFAEGHYNLAIFYDLYSNEALAAQKHFQAYYFLTGNRDDQVRKWLVELQRRTGDEKNYVDVPPPEPKLEQSAAVVAQKGKGDQL